MQNRKFGFIESILSIFALGITISIFLKAIIDIDPNYDVSWYHLPFAARIWGIIPAESFTSESKIEFRYDGFPLLAHFFQGLLWKITGRIQATNLVGYFSLIVYFFFLKIYFKIPLYLSAIAIFTIPAVITHAPTSFVDLPGNIGVSVVMMMGYLFFCQSSLPQQKELLITFLAAAAAANTKPQLQPLIFILYWVIGIRLVWLYFRHTKKIQRKLWQTILLAILASGLIFFTPIKNVALYGNPFYPIKIEIAGVVLNHKLVPQTYSQGNRPQKWLQSIFEINTPQWSADQSNDGGDRQLLGRGGGFFGAYVAFNLLMLLGLSIREQLTKQKSSNNRSNDATIALVTILLISLVPANFPQSHELRYFMFWMITLVSLNLFLVVSLHNNGWGWFKSKLFMLVYLIFFIVMCIKIRSFYLIKDNRTVESFFKNNLNLELLQHIVPDEKNCIISRHTANPGKSPFAAIQHAFYYSSYFHPEIGYDYSLKTAKSLKSCENLNVIPQDARELFQNVN
ncbi:hypothetical protein I4641_02690 [Waterburya agarophytonicola K14]|uniref:Uncharacterized protein n=1 Tax=Waterburya agarophytonicola KI4 TaxID=2874699 RepID=A0A964FFP2_9CYAN|nr:hypothetical protein [Waterburya agarophytonicola]MCC0175889.1 hypothetical protein [Waterburya agarophytonicola KI4]